MKGEIENFKTGWYGLTIGIDESGIDELIAALEALKKSKSHFHCRSNFDGNGGIGDIEFYYSDENLVSNLAVE